MGKGTLGNYVEVKCIGMFLGGGLSYFRNQELSPVADPVMNRTNGGYEQTLLSLEICQVLIVQLSSLKCARRPLGWKVSIFSRRFAATAQVSQDVAICQSGSGEEPEKFRLVFKILRECELYEVVADSPQGP